MVPSRPINPWHGLCTVAPTQQAEARRSTRTCERDELIALELPGLAELGYRHVAALFEVDGFRQVQDGQIDGPALAGYQEAGGCGMGVDGFHLFRSAENAQKKHRTVWEPDAPKEAQRSVPHFP